MRSFYLLSPILRTLYCVKALYLLGVSKLGDATGSYLLEKANYLTGFWRVVTNFPVIAYLDVNRTTVAGGLLLSAILSVPVYFIAKSISAPLLAKYIGSIHRVQKTFFKNRNGRWRIRNDYRNLL